LFTFLRWVDTPDHVKRHAFMADLPSLTDNVTTQLVEIMGTNLVDKLKNIRPFTEGQLLSLHLVDELDDNESFVDSFLQVSFL